MCKVLLESPFSADAPPNCKLIKPERVVTYHCEENPAHELVARYYATKKALALVERGDDSFLLVVNNEAGSHYTGRNE